MSDVLDRLTTHAAEWTHCITPISHVVVTLQAHVNLPVPVRSTR